MFYVKKKVKSLIFLNKNSALKSILLSFLEKGIDILLPPRCFVTGQRVQNQGTISPDLWKKLTFISEPFCDSCGQVFDFKIEKKAICGNCLKQPPAFDQARSALLYNDESRSMILAFKHGDQCHAAKGFANWMVGAGRDLLDQSDLIIPVPLHRKRLWHRRYNQAALLGTAIAKMTNKKTCLDLLIRHKDTGTQGGLKKEERKKNVTNAFSVNPAYDQAIKGKNILLIDDVFTTGATLNACAKTLKKAGAVKVFALCLARV